MPASNPERLLQLVLDVVRTNSCRGVLCAGWTHLKKEEHKDLFICDKIPHDWLFPKCEALVIHGGVGTTGAALRSGRPVVVCPVFADQPFWGRTVARLGCGPVPIPFKDLDSVKLSTALKFCQREEVKAKCATMGKAIKAEWDFGAGAVSWLEDIAASVRPPIAKVATLGTGAILVHKLKGSGWFFRLLMVFIVFMVYYIVF